MIEIPLSIVAWISVVLVQAVVHFGILGARRERLEADEKLIFSEETMSLTTTDGSVDPDEDHLPDGLHTPVISISEKNDGSSYPCIMIRNEKILDDDYDDEPQNFMELLSQTGSEILKNRSVESMVQEQIESS